MKRNYSKDDIRDFLNEKFGKELSSNPGKQGSSELDELWDLSGKALNSPSFSSSDGWQRFASDKGFRPSGSVYRRPWVLGLLALVIIIGMGLLYYFSAESDRSESEHVIIAQMELKYSENLPDGSTIYYHSPDGFEASEEFTPIHRKVSLTGNAYCKIASDEAHPFLIQTPIGLITVLGTEFLVLQDEYSLSVKVKEGKVLIRHLERHDLEAVLVAGQRGELHFDERMILTLASGDDAPQQLIMADASVKDALELVSLVAPDKLRISSESIDQECQITSLWDLKDPDEIKSELELLFNATITNSGKQLVIQDLNCSN